MMAGARKLAGACRLMQGLSTPEDSKRIEELQTKTRRGRDH
jgi:hypothetical protein